jgi:hypothetical protein
MTPLKQANDLAKIIEHFINSLCKETVCKTFVVYAGTISNLAGF